MNVLKNMEAIFIAATVLAGVSTYAEAATSRVADTQKIQAQVQAPDYIAPVAVVKVTAKRLG